MLARAAIGLLLLGAAAAGIALLPGGGGGNATASDPGGPTAPLERRDLTERVSVDGTLGYTGGAQMIDRLAGTITWLPAVGDVIHRGQRVFEVDGEPVLLMYGSVPAYRTLSNGVSDGADVKELEENLAELGFDDGGAMTVDGSFTSATAAAVSDWQDAAGLPQTGSVELGRVVFAPGPRRIESQDVPLGSDASSSPASATGSAASSPESTISAMPATLASVKAPIAKKPAKKPARKPNQGDQSQSDQSAASSSASADTTSAPSVDVLTTTSLRRAVTVDLDPDQLSLAKRGRPARITLPDGKRAKGRISAVGTVAQSSSDSSSQSDAPSSDSSSSTVEVTIALESGGGGLDQAPVTVELIDQVRHDVFAVPVAALVGTAGGHYAIIVHQGTEQRQIAVEPGLFADGYVEVSGRGLTEGMRVEVPQE